jgi:hypothetical protein
MAMLVGILFTMIGLGIRDVDRRGEPEIASGDAVSEE